MPRPIRFLLLALSLAPLPQGSAAPSANHPADKPNIVLCMADVIQSGRSLDSPESILSSNPYLAEQGAIVGHNRPFFNNRPLYGDHQPAFAAAGDRPHLRFANKPNIYGNLTLAVQRGEATRWLHDFADVTSRYRPGRIDWVCRDPLFTGLTVSLEAVPLAAAEGFALRLTAHGSQAGDRLIWTFGGATPAKDASQQNDPVVAKQKVDNPDPLSPVLRKRFQPDDCKGNQLRLDAGRFVLTTADAVRNVIGRCTQGELRLADASAWENPSKLPSSSAGTLPLACGVIDLASPHQACWAVEAVGENVLASPACDDPSAAFARATARVETLGRQVVVDTPEPSLNAGVAAACYAMDSTFYPPVYVHGAMAWNIPFPGWRTIYGPTAFGWHDNVKTEARHYLASQNRDTTARTAQATPFRRLCVQSRESRFHGRGRITLDQGPYNFQTQFFDQLIHAWRSTGDKELEAMLRESLPLHMEWVQDCFDPDNDGLYESYINTWPSDSVWSNGGGSAEETAYAYAGYSALADLAKLAGDDAAAQRHQAQAAKIRAALHDQLWLPKKGYVAQYKEQGGLRRVHEDSWLGAIFLPIETGLLDPAQSAQSLHYTEWALERVTMPFGGNRCWMSNWVPSAWSVREMYPGDNYALALAYFRTGLAEEGWDLLRGNYLESMFHGVVPGGLACANAGTDFTDVLSMFCRTVVEGLFGYRPDYPNGVVRLAPQFPAAWQKASITTPDFTMRLVGKTGVQHWTVDLTRSARLALDVPLRAQEISSVVVNGQPATCSVLPGFGCSIARIETGPGLKSEVVIHYVPVPASPLSTALTAEVGKPVDVAAGPDPIEELSDPQGALTDQLPADGRVTAKAAANPGHHLLQARVKVGDLPQWHLFKLRIDDPGAAAIDAAKRIDKIPPDAKWDTCDIRDRLNADVRTIYQQQYLSPRPQTCSVRLGSDGYSPWTFAYWNTKVPVIDLAQAPSMLDKDGLLRAPQGVPFAWPGGKHNIAFVSQWDNWPRSVTVPVGKSGAAAWFLVCGSTNPMQCRIANARLRLTYADGVTDDLDLVPPLNFWSLCPLGSADYDYHRDRFALPATPPATVQLGENCRAILLNARLRPGVELKQVTLEALSQEVVIGLMGVTVMR